MQRWGLPPPRARSGQGAAQSVGLCELAGRTCPGRSPPPGPPRPAPRAARRRRPPSPAPPRRQQHRSVARRKAGGLSVVGGRTWLSAPSGLAPPGPRRSPEAPAGWAFPRWWFPPPSGRCTRPAQAARPARVPRAGAAPWLGSASTSCRASASAAAACGSAAAPASSAPGRATLRRSAPPPPAAGGPRQGVRASGPDARLRRRHAPFGGAHPASCLLSPHLGPSPLAASTAALAPGWRGWGWGVARLSSRRRFLRFADLGGLMPAAEWWSGQHGLG